MIITQTPLRISFIGGGTDFEDFFRHYPGRVISTTINKYYYVGINYRFDNMIRLAYSEMELVKDRDEIKHPLIKFAIKEASIKQGIDMISLCDLPAQKTGLGLGASSSFIVGLLNGLYVLKGKYLKPKELAEKACEIEIIMNKSPIGKQDQYAAAFGGLNYFVFYPSGKVEIEPIYLSPHIRNNFKHHLLLFFTKKERSASSILKEQKKNIDKKIQTLKEMSDMVIIFKEALQKGDFQILGEILNEGWFKKRSLASKISNRKIDEIYDIARKAGAWGGKILGAGGGGFFLIIAPPSKHQKIKKALNKYPLISFEFSEGGSKIIFNNNKV